MGCVTRCSVSIVTCLYMKDSTPVQDVATLYIKWIRELKHFTNLSMNFNNDGLNNCNDSQVV